MIGPTQVGFKDGRPMLSLHYLFREGNIKKTLKKRMYYTYCYQDNCYRFDCWLKSLKGYFDVMGF